MAAGLAAGLKAGPCGPYCSTSSFCHCSCRGLLLPSSLRHSDRMARCGRGSGGGRAVIVFELRVRALTLRRLIGAVAGSVLGILGAALFCLVLRSAPLAGANLRGVADLRAAADDLCGPAGGSQQGRPAESGGAGHRLRRRQAHAPHRQGARYQRDHRRPHRRHCRGGLYRRHDGGAGVCAARAAGGGRLDRRLEAPARPPRPRHAAAHAVERQRSRCRLCPTTSLPSAKST